MSPDPVSPEPVGRAARLLDRVLWAYQKLTEGRVSPCRYVPSCSTYAREAVAHRGVLRGGLLAVRRLLRCAPWGGWGYDPVPGTEAVASADPHADVGTATDPHADVGTDPSTASTAASSRRTA